MLSEIIFVKERPAVCHKCDSEKIAVVVYGFPKYESKLQKQIAKGEIVLGGCMTYLDSPNWICNVCNQKYRKIVVSKLDRVINTMP